MNRWVPTVIAALVALGIGFGIGAAVFSDDDADERGNGAVAPTTPSDIETPDPLTDEGRDTCLDALASVEQDLEAEQRTSRLLERYEDVLGRSVDAISQLDTRRLEELLSEVEELNRRSQELLDDSRSADVSGALETCRTVLGAD